MARMNEVYIYTRPFRDLVFVVEAINTENNDECDGITRDYLYVSPGKYSKQNQIWRVHVGEGDTWFLGSSWALITVYYCVLLCITVYYGVLLCKLLCITVYNYALPGIRKSGYAVQASPY